MNGLLAGAARRFYLRHPWQLCLALTGIALGVAVYVGVDLANDSARRAFELSAELVTGRTTHHLMGTDGTVSDDTYRELRVRHGPLLAAPVIEDKVRLAHSPSRELTVIGIDPLEETAFRGFSGLVPGRAADLTRLIVEPGTVLVPAALAAEFDLQTGSSLDLLVRETPATVRIVGTVGASSPTTEGATAPLVTDIATAQELFARRSLSRVDLILTEAEARRLEALALEGVTLVPAGGRNAAFDALARAFRINLTALSLLALLVGVFLIYATMSFAVVQRRETFGVLRAIGVTAANCLQACSPKRSSSERRPQRWGCSSASSSPAAWWGWCCAPSGTSTARTSRRPRPPRGSTARAWCWGWARRCSRRRHRRWMPPAPRRTRR